MCVHVRSVLMFVCVCVHVHACVRVYMHVKTISGIRTFSTLQHDYVSVCIHIMYTMTVVFELKHCALENVIVDLFGCSTQVRVCVHVNVLVNILCVSMYASHACTCMCTSI